jgi:hypothetical protein
MPLKINILRILKELSEAIHQKEYQIIFEKQNKME